MCNTYSLAISPLHHELVLKHDEIPLARSVRHQLLEACTQGVEQVVPTGLNLLVREETDPAQTRDNTSRLGLGAKVDSRLDLLDKGAIRPMSACVNMMRAYVRTPRMRSPHRWPFGWSQPR
jgi:hypothetical protein